MLGVNNAFYFVCAQQQPISCISGSESHSIHAHGAFIGCSICKYAGYVISCHDSGINAFSPCTVACITHWCCYIIHPMDGWWCNINRSICQGARRRGRHKTATVCGNRSDVICFRKTKHVKPDSAGCPVIQYAAKYYLTSFCRIIDS